MSNLLKEAIADAKAVRATALANAKAALEEAFQPKLEAMLAEKLKSEIETNEVDHSSSIGKGKGVASSSTQSSTVDPQGADNDMVSLEEESDSVEITDEELNEILAELEGELDEAGQVDPNVPVAPAPVDPTAVPAPAPAPAPAVGQVPSPVAEAAEEDDVTSEEMAEALVAINEENETLKKQLSEALSTVKFMKGVLAETNLLNAKLLYTNKLFKGKSLNEDQKLKIINTFDLTKNIREVKLAYTVLAESLNSGASVVKKKTNTTAQTITEGLASKPVSSTKPDSTIVEPQAEVMTSRFQKLAGIKK